MEHETFSRDNGCYVKGSWWCDSGVIVLTEGSSLGLTQATRCRGVVPLNQPAAAALSVLAVLLTPATATAASGPGDTITLPVRDALAALPVQTESRTGYERTKFRHWTDADRDGCSTRNEVLLEEAVTAPE